MIRVANVNMDLFAKAACNILSKRKDNYVRDAARIIDDGEPDEAIRNSVCSNLRRELFQKVQREGIVSAYTNWQCNSQTGIFRRRRRSLGMSDVPKRFLDVEALIPDLDARIADITLLAKGLVLAEKIQRIAEKEDSRVSVKP